MTVEMCIAFYYNNKILVKRVTLPLENWVDNDEMKCL